MTEEENDENDDGEEEITGESNQTSIKTTFWSKQLFTFYVTYVM